MHLGFTATRNLKLRHYMDQVCTVISNRIHATNVTCTCTGCQLYKLYLQCIHDTSATKLATNTKDRCTYYYLGANVQCVYKRKKDTDFCFLHSRRHK